MTRAERSPLERRLLRTAYVLGGLFVVYTAFGFFGAPPIVKKLLVSKGSAALHRPVSVEKVRVNPLALSVTIAGLSVQDRDGSPFVGWESLYVRLAPLRLLAGDVGLREIRLVRPSIHAGLLADGSLSFQDLLASPAEPAPAQPQAPEKGGGLGLSIGRLAIEQAQVVFHDATRKPAFQSVVGPFTIQLESFRTRGGGNSPYSFSGTTDAGETFRWTGTVGTQPVRSAGTLAFERIALPRYGPYLPDTLPLQLPSGLLDLETSYELEWGPARHVARLTAGKVALSELAITARGLADAPVKLPRIEVTGIQVDAVGRDASVAEVAVRGGSLRVRREADGTLELLRLAPAPAAAPASAPQPGPAWEWAIGAVDLSGLALTWEDRVPPTAAVLPLTGLAVRLEQLRPGADSASPLHVSLDWPGGGKVSVAGSIQPFGNRGTLDVEATALDLVPLASYLQPDLTASLTSARAGAKLQVGFDASGAEARWNLGGDLRLDGLAVAERGNPDLLRWRSLEVTGMDVASTPPHATVKRIRLVDPRVKVFLWPDGTTSLARARGTPAPKPAAAEQPAAPAPAAPAWKTAIGAVEVAGGRFAFVDRSITPQATVEITRATARITNLSSDSRQRSAVDVRLEVEGASPILVKGTLNPLQASAYTDLVVTSQGVDLTPLGPYSGKYLGYGLQKGKLDLELRYQIENRALASTNVVRVNQLTLGDKTESPDATGIPVRLALALLQDRNGVILLDVPVEGKLDDPEFRLGKVIWRTILNVLVKVATSPFRALAALVGGGQEQEISIVEFAPGSPDPTPETAKRFELLAKSLSERPALGLEVEGSTDEAQDGAALRRAALEQSLRHAKAAAMKPRPESEDEVTIAPEEREKLVRAAYLAAFPPAKAVPAEKGAAAEKEPGAKAEAPPEPTLQEMEEQLAARVQLAPDALTELAAERARRARDALVTAGIDQTRLFLTQGGERAAKEKGPRVYFGVK